MDDSAGLSYLRAVASQRTDERWVMQIGELVTQTGFSRDTIRYYERRGLLPDTDIAYRANGNKDYAPVALQRLRSIDALKTHGFTLSEIRSLAPRLDPSIAKISALKRSSELVRGHARSQGSALSWWCWRQGRA